MCDRAAMQGLLLADIPPGPPKKGCATTYGLDPLPLLGLLVALFAGRALRRRPADAIGR
jgi:hypothetical protein